MDVQGSNNGVISVLVNNHIHKFSIGTHSPSKSNLRSALNNHLLPLPSQPSPSVFQQIKQNPKYFLPPQRQNQQTSNLSQHNSSLQHRKQQNSFSSHNLLAYNHNNTILPSNFSDLCLQPQPNAKQIPSNHILSSFLTNSPQNLSNPPKKQPPSNPHCLGNIFKPPTPPFRQDRSKKHLSTVIPQSIFQSPLQIFSSQKPTHLPLQLKKLPQNGVASHRELTLSTKKEQYSGRFSLKGMNSISSRVKHSNSISYLPQVAGHGVVDSPIRLKLPSINPSEGFPQIDSSSKQQLFPQISGNGQFQNRQCKQRKGNSIPSQICLSFSTDQDCNIRNQTLCTNKYYQINSSGTFSGGEITSFNNQGGAIKLQQEAENPQHNSFNSKFNCKLHPTQNCNHFQQHPSDQGISQQKVCCSVSHMEQYCNNLEKIIPEIQRSLPHSHRFLEQQQQAQENKEEHQRNKSTREKLFRISKTQVIFPKRNRLISDTQDTLKAIFRTQVIEPVVFVPFKDGEEDDESDVELERELISQADGLKQKKAMMKAFTQPEADLRKQMSLHTPPQIRGSAQDEQRHRQTFRIRQLHQFPRHQSSTIDFAKPKEITFDDHLNRKLVDLSINQSYSCNHELQHVSYLHEDIEENTKYYDKKIILFKENNNNSPLIIQNHNSIIDSNSGQSNNHNNSYCNKSITSNNSSNKIKKKQMGQQEKLEMFAIPKKIQSRPFLKRRKTVLPPNTQDNSVGSQKLMIVTRKNSYWQMQRQVEMRKKQKQEMIRSESLHHTIAREDINEIDDQEENYNENQQSETGFKGSQDNNNIFQAHLIAGNDQIQENANDQHKSNHENFLESSKTKQIQSEDTTKTCLTSKMTEMISPAASLRSQKTQLSSFNADATAASAANLLLSKGTLSIKKVSSYECVEQSEDIASRSLKSFQDIELREVLGEGAYGKVFKGFLKQTGKFIAVKQLRVSSQKDDQSKLEQYMKEIIFLYHLDHPHIVHYYDCRSDGDFVYIYMEQMIGGSIAQMLEKFGRFDEALIKKFIKQIMLGLVYLHSQGIVHRDIKGANILSDGNGIVKLADFGAARYRDIVNLQSAALQSSEVCSSIKGSLYWMAPELMNQEPYGRKSDIWSLGCTLIEMATAKHPWPDCKSLPQLAQTVKTKRCPPIPEDLSDSCKDFVQQCCTFDKKLRPTAESLLNHPFLSN